MFELVFEGPVDESAETLRVLKGVFISDLEMSVDQVREILAHAPITIKQSDDRSELERNQGALQKAGGKVLIVEPDFGDDDDEADQAPEISFEFEFDGNDNLNGTTTPSAARSVLDSAIESHEPAANPEEIDSLLAQLDNQTILDKPAPHLFVEQLDQKIQPVSEVVPPSASSPEVQLNSTQAEPEHAPKIEQVPPPVESAPVSANVPQQPITPPPEQSAKSTPQAEPEPVQPAPSPIIPDAPKAKLGKLGSNFMKGKKRSKAVSKAKDESSAEDREQVLSVEILLPRNRKRYSFPVEAILSACIAIVVLSAGNYIIMSRQQKIATGAALDHYMMRMANPETPAEMQPTANPKIVPVPNSEQTVVSGHNTTDDQEIISRFVVDSNSVVSMTVHLVSRAKAPELSPEQLVHHDQAPLWINRVDADDFEVTQLAGGRFIARGKAKVFVEQDKNRRRIAAKATVTGNFESGQQKVSATLRLDRGTFETFPGSSAIERSGDGTERLTLSVPLSAEEVEQGQIPQ